jgi:hypothetical protein
MDFSVLADRDCLFAFAAVVLRSDRGVEAHKRGYDHGGIAHLTAKGAAGRRRGWARPRPGGVYGGWRRRASSSVMGTDATTRGSNLHRLYLDDL